MALTIRDIVTKKDVLIRVIELARNHRLSIEVEQGNRSDGDISEALKKMMDENKEETALLDYLSSLDFDDIKMIQALMFLGRDQDFNDYESYSERLEKVYTSLEKHSEAEKTSKINYMIEKVRLDEFVMEGLKAVGISF